MLAAACRKERFLLFYGCMKKTRALEVQNGDFNVTKSNW
jgi:hypothetical protein